MPSTFRFTKNASPYFNLYRIIDHDHTIFGEFYYHQKRQYLKCANTEIDIQTISKLFKKTQYLLVDPKNGNKQIGKIELFDTGIIYYWKDAPGLRSGRLTLNKVVYNFKRIAPAVRESFLKKDTYGYFKFRLHSIVGDDYAEYDLKMDLSMWKHPGAANKKPFDGTVETNMNNFPALLAACFIMEQEFREDGESWEM